VLSVLLRFTISDYPYDIFKLLLDNILTVNNPNFLAFVHQIYSMELRLDKANIFFPYRKFSTIMTDTFKDLIHVSNKINGLHGRPE
jgi:hypothetical protein